VRRAFALAPLVALLATAGCGGGKSERDRVNSYLDRVNSVQQSAAPEFNRANRAYLAFSKGKLGIASAKRELTKAEQSMRAVRDQIAATKAPVSATKLKRRLVAMFDADAAMAHEATLLATFIPAAQKAAQPLPGLGKRLARGLQTAKTAADQERALSAYSRGVRGVVAQLEPLHPPPLLLDRQNGQIEHLQAVQRLAAELVQGLRAQDTSRVARLLLRFKKLSTQGAAPPVSADALNAYHHRYLAVQQTAQNVERERQRLETTLK
jgi:hypothetical protein